MFAEHHGRHKNPSNRSWNTEVWFRPGTTGTGTGLEFCLSPGWVLDLVKSQVWVRVRGVRVVLLQRDEVQPVWFVSVYVSAFKRKLADDLTSCCRLKVHSHWLQHHIFVYFAMRFLMCPKDEWMSWMYFHSQHQSSLSLRLLLCIVQKWHIDYIDIFVWETQFWTVQCSLNCEITV